MEFVLETLRSDTEALLRFAPRFFYGVGVLIFSMVVAHYAARGVGRILSLRARLRANLKFFERVTAWLIGAIGILVALSVMGFTGVAASMLATGGVVAIVLGFAFREIGENLLAGVFLTFSRPFEVGDLIKTGELTGTVRSVQLRDVHIRTADACDVFVPSARIYREPLYNYTRDGLRRPAFRIGIAYQDEPERALELLDTATRAVPDVLEDPAPVVAIAEFSAQVIEYEVQFWIDVTRSERGLVGTTNDVRIACWRALRDAGLTFSTDVTTGLDIKSAPELTVALARGQD